MKQILWVYAFLVLILVAILSVLSYDIGTGYVYILWHGVQIQTNVWVIIFFTVLISLIMQMLWLISKRYLSREQRKIEQVLNFKTLHPYEQLGVIWILDGDEEQQDFVQQIFDQSGLLKQIIQARLFFKQNQFDQALAVLALSPASAFELSEIQRIEIYLAQNDQQQALTHLNFLSGHELSPYLEQVRQAYSNRITELWGKFAIQFPWAYLNSTHCGQLHVENKQGWLTQLLGQFEDASPDDLFRLQQRYFILEENIESMVYETKLLWLKLLTRMPEMGMQSHTLALQLLNEKFDQEVFYLWFQQQLLKQNPDYDFVEQQIIQFEARYPSMPIFTFVQWHIYIQTDRIQQADQLLLLYPNDILMSYLRIKTTFNGNEELIQQLNLIFAKDSNFIQFKI